MGYNLGVLKCAHMSIGENPSRRPRSLSSTAAASLTLPLSLPFPPLPLPSLSP
jgi:hypothetical protein